jgi:hypothetical protein
MADTKKWNPYEAAAEVLQNRKKDIDSASEEKSQKKDDRTKKAEDDPSRDPAEEKELTKSAPRLRDYRIKKSIGGDSPAEVRLYDLQMKRLKSYKKGTKKVAKTGLAKLHKGEAVLTKKQAAKYRGRKVKGAASALGAGTHKKPAKKGVSFTPAGRVVRAIGTSGQGSTDPNDAVVKDRALYEKRELRKNMPRLKAYREQHGIAEPTAAEKQLDKLEKEQTVRLY